MELLEVHMFGVPIHVGVWEFVKLRAGVNCKNLFLKVIIVTNVVACLTRLRFANPESHTEAQQIPFCDY